jgi:hypothetical protein
MIIAAFSVNPMRAALNENFARAAWHPGLAGKSGTCAPDLY